METPLLARLRVDLDAEAVTLVQVVVRGDTLLLGRRITATAAGVEDARPIGRPVAEAAAQPERDTLLERYHLDGGGVVGVAPPGAAYKAGEGLQPLDRQHVLIGGPCNQPEAAAWLVLDGVALGLVHARGLTLHRERQERALPNLLALRRRLARRFEVLTPHLTATGMVMLGDDGVQAADRLGAAWANASPASPIATGLVGGALVVPKSLVGDSGSRFATVRPVRPPTAPIGLHLTSSEREVARYLSSSATLAEIASFRHTSPATVRRQRDDIYAALGVSRRVEVAQRLRQI